MVSVTVLEICDIKAILIGSKPKTELNRKYIDAHVRLLLPLLLAIELALLCQMCDLHFKFEEYRTKTAVAVDSDRYSTDRQTLRAFLYLSDAMTITVKLEIWM